MRPVVLIDLENVVGTRSRMPYLRACVTTLLTAAGPRHHAVAAYAGEECGGDPVASVLAALGVAPLRVPPGPDAAEQALIEHARRVQAEGCTRFIVCSSDRAFAVLADAAAADLEVLVWQGQPVAARLTEAARAVRTLSRPDRTGVVVAAPPLVAGTGGTGPATGPGTGTGTGTGAGAGVDQQDRRRHLHARRPRLGTGDGGVPTPATALLLGIAVGVGVAMGQRTLDRVLAPRTWRARRRR